jgi:hypothetical protein
VVRGDDEDMDKLGGSGKTGMGSCRISRHAAVIKC